MDESIELLIADGWKEYPDSFKKYARSFYKRFNTPTRCCCNNDKWGQQVCLSVSDLGGRVSFELDLSGELTDGTWVALKSYSYAEVTNAISAVPRLLNLWEVAANCGNPPTERSPK